MIRLKNNRTNAIKLLNLYKIIEIDVFLDYNHIGWLLLITSLSVSEKLFFETQTKTMVFCIICRKLDIITNIIILGGNHMKLSKKVLVGVIGLSMLALTACGAKEAGLKDGTYTGTGTGYNGDIQIELVVSGGKVTDLKAVEHKETDGISDGAFEGIKDQLLEKQSAEKLDTVSGATGTSKGLIEAVNEALPKAKQ